MFEHDAGYAIQQLLNTKTREAIIDYINSYGDDINWDNYTTEQILEEVWRSDCSAAEQSDGILASMYSEL